MDNSYYTGATLIRGAHNRYHHHQYQPHIPNHHQAGPPSGHINGVPLQSQIQHHHIQHHSIHPHHISFHQNGPNGNYPQKNAPNFPMLSLPPPTSNSLTGPPLLMQPRNSNKNSIFSGTPLIRNGPQQQNNVPQNQSCNKPVPIMPVAHNSTAHSRSATGHPSSPGLICCYQPVYYLPINSQCPSQQPPMSMNQHPPNHGLSSSPSKKSATTLVSNAISPTNVQKRRNYKSLQSSSMTQQKSTQGGNHSSQGSPLARDKSRGQVADLEKIGCCDIFETATLDNRKNFHEDIPSLSQSPNGNLLCGFPVAVRQPNDVNGKLRSTSVSSASSQGFSGSCSSGSSSGDENEFLAAQDQQFKKSISLEDRVQSNEKILNFYFYEEYWRPQEPNKISSPSSDKTGMQSLNESLLRMSVANPVQTNDDALQNSWFSKPTSQQLTDDSNNNSLSTEKTNHLDTHHASNERFGSFQNEFQQTSALPTSFRSTYLRDHCTMKSETTIQPAGTDTTGKKRDLEVEAEIVTLANGHRDLEIRLCYVNS